MTAFDHSLYYSSNAKLALSRYAALSLKAFPTLRYTAPHLRGLARGSWPSCRVLHQTLIERRSSAAMDIARARCLYHLSLC